MSNFVIALLVSLGSTAWIYNKFSKRSGDGNLKPAIIAAAVSGLILFIVSFSLLSLIIKK
jgi:hypothetical protein